MASAERRKATNTGRTTKSHQDEVDLRVVYDLRDGRDVVMFVECVE